MESTLLYNIPEFAKSAMPLEWPIAKLGAVGAVVLLMTAPVLLIIDLNQPLRFWHLFVYLNPTSPLTWGSFFLAADAVVCLVYTYFVLQNNTRMARMWGWAGCRLPSPDTVTPGSSWPSPKAVLSGTPP